jgi:Domain of unknown function (DUF3850)
MAKHDMRCRQGLYVGVVHGQKMFEIAPEPPGSGWRRGDQLTLHEWDDDQDTETGRSITVDVMQVWHSPANREWIEVKLQPQCQTCGGSLPPASARNRGAN